MIVTPFIAGLLAIAQIPLTVVVGLRRLATDIRFLDGADDILVRRMRAHGNFTETVPIALIVLGLAETLDMPHWGLWALGAALVVGRALHIQEILRTGWGPGRSLGMILTFLAMLGGGGWCLWRSSEALLG
jgi:uncharacterized protein